MWSTGATTSSVSNITAGGEYTVSVKDSAGKTLSDSISVSSYSIPSVTIIGDSAMCKGADILTASPTGKSPFTFSWNTAGTNDTISVQSVKNFANTYSVTITDSNGCTAKNSFVIYRDSMPSINICMVSVDTGSVHNIVEWDKSGLTRIDSFKLYYMNSSSTWQLVKAVPFSAPNYIVDSTPINNPNANTVRYCLTVVDSCGNEEHFKSSPWQNTSFIINTGGGTFYWGTTGYLKEGIAQPVITYYLMRDSISNGNWRGIDSVSGTQNQMTDINYSSFPKARWRVDALLNDSINGGCTIPLLKPVKGKTYNASHSNTANTSVYTGMQNMNHSMSISVYPNPADKVLNIKFNFAKVGSADIRVLDITGRLISETQNEINSGSTIPLNIASLPTGIYFVKITTSTSSQVVKFVKE